MSRFHFERVFHQVTGLSPFQFLSAMRLVRARDLVLGTAASITTICFDVGYNSVGTFTRRFTDAVGASPRRLRRFSRTAPAAALIAPAASPGIPGEAAGADVVVRCHGTPERARLFIAAFPAPAPIGRPLACTTTCAATAGTSTVVLRGVPRGRHYILVAARAADARGDWFSAGDLLVGIADPGPVELDGSVELEVSVALHPIDVTDPPVVSFLPLWLHEHHAASNDQAPAGARSAS